MEFLYILFAIAVVFLFFFRREIKEKIAPNKTRNYTIDDKFNSEKREKEKEIDDLLGKIDKNGIADLSEKDKKRLDELSKKIK
ncbi:DUF6576 domain-containing protein [Kaistella sp.]|uniref:DUF6576 domain-containing protein n=1 Tax=Kaistella sp. TaxID=2782235 RepID=UPI003C615D3F